jgi:hypothetical protein
LRTGFKPLFVLKLIALSREESSQLKNLVSITRLMEYVCLGLISLDKTVTSGLGLRWALTGPIMTNTLGGGGDFNHFINHLGPALKIWLDDMHQHEFDIDSRDADVLEDKVKDWISRVNLKEIEERRDELLVGLIRSKKERSP